MQTMKELWQGNGTTWMLEQFGLWANQSPNLNLGYPKRTNFAMMQGRSVSLPRIDDEVAGFIHDSINELGGRSIEHKEILILFYIKRRSFVKVAECLCMSRPKATEFMRGAEAWIDCKLNDYFKLNEAQRIILRMALDKFG
jgi:hypothetical protein